MSIEATEKALILIVDDSAANLGILSEFLANDGYRVRLEKDGKSAIDAIEVQKPDLILLDAIMPGMDGFETCKWLQASAEFKDIPILFMTALSDPADKVKAFDLGAVDYLTKPFQQEEVLARIRLHLRLRSLTQTLKEQNQQLQKEVEDRIEAEAALQELARTLEQRVRDRTLELSNSFEELQNTQTQLIQTEKMASIGEIVAGVAHEINNPIGFIAGNLKHLEEAIAEILDHLHLYQNHCTPSIAAIKEHEEQIDLNYLIEDIPHMLHAMKLGVDRIGNISISLRNFSRADTSAKVVGDLLEGIESTLLILQHRLKGNSNRPSIKIIKEYNELPPIPCYPAQLNQVFMNLLANAIDALEEKYQTDGEKLKSKKDKSEFLDLPEGEQPTIWIRTESIDDRGVIIRIADNGAGIDPEICDRLFEPMFTTKPRGKGTGLGLSISRQIVEERHGGSLTCHSIPGEGSEFAIAIPIEDLE